MHPVSPIQVPWAWSSLCPTETHHAECTYISEYFRTEYRIRNTTNLAPHIPMSSRHIAKNATFVHCKRCTAKMNVYLAKPTVLTAVQQLRASQVALERTSGKKLPNMEKSTRRFARQDALSSDHCRCRNKSQPNHIAPTKTWPSPDTPDTSITLIITSPPH